MPSECQLLRLFLNENGECAIILVLICMSKSSETVFHNQALAEHEGEVRCDFQQGFSFFQTQFSPPSLIPSLKLGGCVESSWVLPPFRLRIKEEVSNRSYKQTPPHQTQDGPGMLNSRTLEMTRASPWLSHWDPLLSWLPLGLLAGFPHPNPSQPSHWPLLAHSLPCLLVPSLPFSTGAPLSRKYPGTSSVFSIPAAPGGIHFQPPQLSPLGSGYLYPFLSVRKPELERKATECPHFSPSDGSEVPL